MRAVVLVGGFGTRLRPLTLTRPKQMLPILGRPMIEWVVAELVAHGVDEIVLSLGYRPEPFIEAFPDGHLLGARLHYAVEPDPLDTAGAIAFAAREAGFDRHDEPFIAVNGDVLTDLDITALVAFHKYSGAEATIALTKVDDPSRFGVVPTDGSGRVLGFIEKPPRESAPTQWINAGTYVLDRRVLDRIPSGQRVSIERATFPAMAEEGVMFAMESDAYWLDTGTPAQYVQAQTDILSGIRVRANAVGVHVNASVHESARIEMSVVDSGCIVESGAVVINSVLLPDCRVSAGALIVDSVLGEGVTVGAHAEVTGVCVIGDGEIIEPHARMTAVKHPDPER